jgi:hypothetical protein
MMKYRDKQLRFNPQAASGWPVSGHCCETVIRIVEKGTYLQQERSFSGMLIDERNPA